MRSKYLDTKSLYCNSKQPKENNSTGLQKTTSERRRLTRLSDAWKSKAAAGDEGFMTSLSSFTKFMLHS